uniref:Uncharacterized protein n=1 Tax=Dongbei arctic lamprey calicivirus 1 TaxID=2116166 RepID=A0A2P1GMJ4_9CALI|nr:hypothetical protein [Dongbei arctic lamprey calicivirus 1]
MESGHNEFFGISASPSTVQPRGDFAAFYGLDKGRGMGHGTMAADYALQYRDQSFMRELVNRKETAFERAGVPAAYAHGLQPPILREITGTNYTGISFNNFPFDHYRMLPGRRNRNPP